MPGKQVSLSEHVWAELTVRFIVRDFHWDDSASEKQKKELVELEQEEKELWVRHGAVSFEPCSCLRPSCYGYLESTSQRRTKYWHISRLCGCSSNLYCVMVFRQIMPE